MFDPGRGRHLDSDSPPCLLQRDARPAFPHPSIELSDLSFRWILLDEVENHFVVALPSPLPGFEEPAGRLVNLDAREVVRRHRAVIGPIDFNMNLVMLLPKGVGSLNRKTNQRVSNQRGDKLVGLRGWDATDRETLEFVPSPKIAGV